MSKKDLLPFQVTLHVRDHCLCMHLQRAARATARLFDEALRPHGLTSGQFSILMSLNRPEPPTVGSVANLLAMDRTTLTANIKPLVRRGLMEVEVDESDRRSRRLKLTEAGRKLLANAFPVWKETHEEVDARLAPSDAGQLRADLIKLA